jgi:hypothetical protein
MSPSVELAFGKARTAASFKKPSQQVYCYVTPGGVRSGRGALGRADRTDGSTAGNISQIPATDNKIGRSVSGTLRL